MLCTLVILTDTKIAVPRVIMHPRHCIKTITRVALERGDPKTRARKSRPTSQQSLASSITHAAERFLRHGTLGDGKNTPSKP